MDVPQISPGKFATLPEDIRARITRTAGGGVLTRQHQELTIADRVNDAGTKPFTKSEAKWIIDVRRMLSIMYEWNGTSKNQILISKTVRSYPILIESDVFDVIFEENNIDMDHYGSGDEYNKLTIADVLTGRLDSGIVKEAYFPEIYLYDGDNNEFVPNVILLDVRSIFLILRKRFEIIVPLENVELARKYTQVILDNIVDDFQGHRIFSLLEYLMCNVLLFDVDINAKEYIRNYENDDISMQEVIAKCTKLYKILSSVVNGMI